MGNVLQGVPFRFNSDLRIFYEGSFFGLLNPFALLCGLLSVAMLVMHGGAWLVLKTSGPVAERARNFGSLAALVTIALFCCRRALRYGPALAATGSPASVDPMGPSNPLLKTVVVESGAWFANYGSYPVASAGAGLSASLARQGRCSGWKQDGRSRRSFQARCRSSASSRPWASRCFRSSCPPRSTRGRA